MVVMTSYIVRSGESSQKAGDCFFDCVYNEWLYKEKANEEVRQ